MKIIRTSTVPESLYGLLKGQLQFLSKSFEVVGISSDGRYLNETNRREGIKTIPVNMKRGISPINDVVSLVRLYLVFKKEKPLIVHSITPKAGLLSMLAAKFAGVPIRIHTFTGLIFPTKTGFLQKVLIKMDQLLCWSATNVYPEGNGVKNDLINYNITTKPLKVLANGNVNGIDLEFFNLNHLSVQEKDKIKKELDISDSDFVFIFVGRLVGDKGINELVNAFKEFEFPNVKLLLVGRLEDKLDPLNNETKQEIESNTNIISVGFQKDVRPYFATADALVFPSYREGFPNVVMQAGAMELPSIVSNINGCNEIIVEGINGTIIPSKNKEAILNAMLKFVSNKEYHNQLKANARTMIEERYEKSVVWNAILNEYNLLIEKSKS